MGEVRERVPMLARRAGAPWLDFDADQRAHFGRPIGVRMPDGRVRNSLREAA